eukprot:s157_g37.t1
MICTENWVRTWFAVCETAPNVAANVAPAAAEAMKMFASCPNASQRLKRKVSSAAVQTFDRCRCSKISASELRVQAVNETGDEGVLTAASLSDVIGMRPSSPSRRKLLEYIF